MSCFEKVHGGYKVDGLELKAAGQLRLRRLDRPRRLRGLATVASPSPELSMRPNTIFFFAKNTTPNTTNNYEWGYRVQKGDHIVDVQMLDTRGPWS